MYLYFLSSTILRQILYFSPGCCVQHTAPVRSDLTSLLAFCWATVDAQFTRHYSHLINNAVCLKKQVSPDNYHVGCVGMDVLSLTSGSRGLWVVLACVCTTGQTWRLRHQVSSDGKNPGRSERDSSRICGTQSVSEDRWWSVDTDCDRVCTPCHVSTSVLRPYVQST